MIDRDKFMSAAEVVKVLGELRRKAKRTKSTRRNLILFELSVCCGLRVSEIIGLRIRDIRLGVTPSIRVPAAVGKGSKARTVPLIWDVDTLSDLTAWIAIRRADGAGDDDLLLITRHGGGLDRFNARRVFVRACRVTGRKITIHAGRHTFASHALRVRNLVDVRDALGHASISTTNIYMHMAEQDDKPGRLYATV